MGYIQSSRFDLNKQDLQPSLLETTHKLYTAYDRGLSSRIVFIDISKTFDRIIHSGLIYNSGSQSGR